MQVRYAVEEDLPAIATLSRELARHVDDPDPGTDIEGLRENCFGPDRWARCIVAEEDGAVVGFAVFSRQYEAHTRRRSLYLSDLEVREGERRGGTGRKLIDFLKDHGRAHGCSRINLELWAENHSARPFYERIGARFDDEVDILRIPLG
ncbi:GNAT family N-acetyltransferase [Acidimangrovimonas pyrenivorans]|uniref:GNAT family N-acetyltransferase n=1 Tax=Acidimangrovimonas pyrenivorans TaxID=2030798 RepID=A0ABV7AEM9_9RHOB